MLVCIKSGLNILQVVVSLNSDVTFAVKRQIVSSGNNIFLKTVFDLEYIRNSMLIGKYFIPRDSIHSCIGPSPFPATAISIPIL